MIFLINCVFIRFMASYFNNVVQLVLLVRSKALGLLLILLGR